MNSFQEFQDLKVQINSATTNSLTNKCFNAKPKSKVDTQSFSGNAADHTLILDRQINQSTVKNATVMSDQGTVRNLPQCMLSDAFGLAAFFVGLKASANHIRTSPDVVSTEVLDEMAWIWKKDQDASSSHFAYKNFSGPLTTSSEPESFSTEIAQDLPIYPEYLVTNRMIFETQVADVNYVRKTWALKVDKFSDDLLFYIFYMFTRDILQVVAASYLYQKGWRYHKVAKLWLQRVENEDVHHGTPMLEKGIYKYFDCSSWKIVQLEISLDVNNLEGPPKVPTEFFISTCPKP